MHRHILFVAVMFHALMFAGQGLAEETRITVRAIAQGAKFIGTSMGGVRVTIADADTGMLLAEGVTVGGTGDTRRIMIDPHGRGAALSSEGAAKFDAVVDIRRPTPVVVTAIGPMAQRQSAATVSQTRWLLPGKDMTGGDGVLLEMPGFVVDVLSPSVHKSVSGGGETVVLRAAVSMMCGCQITPGGLWNADQYEVSAYVYRNGALVGEQGLAYAGEASNFVADLVLSGPGVYEAVVGAYDPATGATGADSVTFIIPDR